MTQQSQFVPLVTTGALFRIGSGAPSKVYLGSAAIQNVPGAPVILSAIHSGGSTNVVANLSSDTGGLPITSVRFYVNDVLDTSGNFSPPADVVFNANLTGDEITISAVNAIGEGPKSAAVTVT